MAAIVKDLGAVSAYAYAVEKGYTGTEEEYAELMASYATVAEDAAASAAAAETAQGKAEDAQTAAETAQGKAEDAQTAAETAQTAAETAQGKAEDAQTAAETAQGKAENAQAAAETAEGGVEADALKAEGYAVGQQNGTDVGSDSPYYHNNAKYFKEQAASSATAAGNAQTAAETAQGKAEDAAEEAAASAASIDPDTLAKVDGYYEELTAGNAEQLIASVGVNDKVPYNFRTSGGGADVGNRETVNAIVGGTIAWNQLMPISSKGDSTVSDVAIENNDDGSYTLNGTASASTANYWFFGQYSASAVAVMTFLANHVYLIDSVYVDYPTSDNAGTISYSGSTNNIVGTSRLVKVGNADYKARAIKTANFVNGQVYSDFKIYPMIIDLTQMFGSTIADYIYMLEQTTAGAGVAWFKSLFPKDYYAYDAGSLQSVQTSAHKTIGFNQWDEEWELGNIDAGTGLPVLASNTIRSKNFSPCLPNTIYYACGNNGATFSGLSFYDANKDYVGYYGSVDVSNKTFTTPNNAYYFKFAFVANYGTVYKNDVCINLSWDGERDGEYEPYEAHTYALDDSLVLRGIPKLDANNKLYYDGDTYKSDGTVTRKYGIVDLGTLTWTEASGFTGKRVFYTDTYEWNIKRVNFDEIPNMLCKCFTPTKQSATLWYPGEIVLVRSGGVLPAYALGCIVPTGSYVDAAAFKTAMSGVYLVYELATTTTETADPYQQVQIVNDFGAEEYVDAATRDVKVPVGHNTLYQNNLRAKLEMAPESPSGNGDYIVRQTNGINEYVPLIISDELPDAPTTDGTYVLKVVVADGVASYSWVSE